MTWAAVPCHRPYIAARTLGANGGSERKSTVRLFPRFPMAQRRLRELEVARRQVRGLYSGQRDAVVRIVGYDSVCSDLLGISHRRGIIH